MSAPRRHNNHILELTMNRAFPTTCPCPIASPGDWLYSMIFAVPAGALLAVNPGFFLRCLLLLGVSLASCGSASGAPVLRLEWTLTRGAEPLALHDSLPLAENGPVALTRLDLLLTGLGLQRQDGTWLESRDWTAYLSAASGRLSATADGLPEEEFRAIRFRVGVDPETNHADPNLQPADSALHPGLNGLHWNWQDGYIFVAVEGRWPGAPSGNGGFSFHLGNDENATLVELPVRFRGGGPLTVRMVLDAGKLLEGVNFARDGNSTHSRPGDPIAARLKANLGKVFRVESVRADTFQPVPVAESAPSGGGKTTPYPLEITERFPKVKLPADNPLTTQGVELGRRLFHDPRFSINNSQSCASCHDRTAAFSDVRRVSLGAEGQVGRRQAMPLFNLAWAHEFFWDGRAKSLREQALVPIEDPTEMNEKLDRVLAKLEADATYPAMFEAAFGAAEKGSVVTAARLGLAIEQFLLTLVSQESQYDRAARNQATLTEQEKLGLQLFITEHDPRLGLRGADCFHCHGGNLFTNHQFLNNGLEPREDDAGRMEATQLQIDRHLFKVPSLRNVAATAPYMHDGRFQTLEEVIEHYDHGVQRSPTLDPNLAKHPPEGLRLSAEEKAALVAFLRTLTDDAFLKPGEQPPGDLTRP